MQQQNNDREIVFVIEVCENCSSHGWNTRHNEAKYQEFFTRMANAIAE